MSERETFCLSNFEMRVVCEGRVHFERAVRIAFGAHSKAVAYCKPSPSQIVLLWHKNTTLRVSRDSDRHLPVEKLPYELDADKAIEFLWGWLQTVTKEEMGRAPDLDGSVSARAFRIEASGWSPYEILRLTKEWAEYHK